MKSLFALLLALGALLHQEESRAEELSIYTAHEPPLNFTTKADTSLATGDDVTGFTTDIVREIVKRTGSKAQIQMIPWARAYKEAQDGPNVFLYTMARLPARDKLFKWVGPIALKKAMFIAKKGSGIRVGSLEDAKRLDGIGVLRDGANETFLKTNGFANIHPVGRWDHAIKMLMAGRLALVAQADMNIPVLAMESGFKPSDFVPVYATHEYVMYIGVSLATSDALVQRWQKALDEIKADGTFERTIKKWSAYYETDDWVYRDGQLQSR